MAGAPDDEPPPEKNPCRLDEAEMRRLCVQREMCDRKREAPRAHASHAAGLHHSLNPAVLRLASGSFKHAQPRPQNWSRFGGATSSAALKTLIHRPCPLHATSEGEIAATDARTRDPRD